MKKSILSVIFTFLLAISCSDNDDIIISACGVNNPAQELEWLRAEIDRRNKSLNEDLKYCFIVQAQLDGQDVFIYEDCNPLIDKIIPIFNCEGILINTSDTLIAFDNLQNQTIIWEPNNFVCQISF